MTILSNTERSYMMTSTAYVLDLDKDVASAWANDLIYKNPALKWIVGNYVEADNSNSNGQYWSLEDLQLKSATVNHGPMNIAHVANDVVGTYVGSELLYPTQAGQRAYIETVAAMWKYYFNKETAIVEAAHAEGTLYQSMECVSDTVTCVPHSKSEQEEAASPACGQTFPYDGPYGAYCEHIEAGTAARQFDNPHFLGGGLIIPPLKPGWRNAEIQEISTLMNTDMAESVSEQVAVEASHLDDSQQEALAQEIVLEGMVTESDNIKVAEKAGRLLGILAARKF